MSQFVRCSADITELTTSRGVSVGEGCTCWSGTTGGSHAASCIRSGAQRAAACGLLGVNRYALAQAASQSSTEARSGGAICKIWRRDRVGFLPPTHNPRALSLRAIACLDTCGVCPFFRSQQSYSRACVDLGAQWPMTCGGDEGFLFCEVQYPCYTREGGTLTGPGHSVS